MSIKPTPLLARIAAKTRPDGEHLIWTGRFSGERPVVDLPRPKQGNERNVRTVLMEAAGTSVPQNMSPVLLCGVRGCVLPGHCEVIPFRTRVPRNTLQSSDAAGQPPSRLPAHLKYTVGARSVWQWASEQAA